jgi:hypothetical protein
LERQQTSSEAAQEIMSHTIKTYWLGLTIVAMFASCATAPLDVRKGSSLMTTRELLTRGNREAPGYGAYSYLLIPLDPKSDERYLAVLEAYAALPPNKNLGPDDEIVARAERNLTHVPVKAVDPIENMTGEWLVEQYDVARAAAILHVQGLVERGPYLVTSRQPLSLERSKVELSIVDLSSAPKEDMKLWLANFVRVASSRNEWSRSTAEALLLKLNALMTQLDRTLRLTVKSIEPTSKILQIIGGKAAQVQ